MTRLMMLLSAWLCAMAIVVAASSAHAAGTLGISYVSNSGSDSNSCQYPSTACRSFAYALSQTTVNGQIDCVNTGFYDSNFTITQSVTIDCAGGIGSTFGLITINGGGIIVRLRNLSLNGQGSGNWGIDGKNMAALYIENCVITNYTPGSGNNSPFIGIKFEPSMGSSQLFVSNTTIGNNGSMTLSNTGGSGIDIVPAAGAQANVSISLSQIEGNVFGIIADGLAGGTIRGLVKDSVVSGNSQNGITVSSNGANDVVMVDGTAVSENGNNGLVAGGSGAGMLVSNTDVFSNGGGLYTTGGGTLFSYGNNSVNGNNGNDGSFTGSVSLR
jgi:hypothetical protein